MECLIPFNNTTDLLADAKQIIDAAKEYAYRSVNVAMLQRNWYLGKRINDEILKGEDRAEYGAHVIVQLSKSLTNLYGKGFTKSYLYNYVRFYKVFPDIFQSPIGQLELLSWTHYYLLLDVGDDEARAWYAQEAFRENWSVRTLRRNISSQYYHRLLLSQVKEPVIEEMKHLTRPYQADKLEFIKNPVVAEFLGLQTNISFTETDLESAIISNLQQFLMELGKGYAFVARQQHIRTTEADYYIDLVFYNYILKCFVLIDLKTTKISYQDVGQMDMYLQLYDAHRKGEGDNPSIGIVLCSDTNEDVAR